jgi:predicted esterase
MEHNESTDSLTPGPGYHIKEWSHRKILFLHGFGGCEDVAELQTDGFRILGWDVHILVSDIKLTRKEIQDSKVLDETSKRYGLEGAGKGNGNLPKSPTKLSTWFHWMKEEDGTIRHNEAEAEHSIDLILDHIVSLGGVDGIIGFSQGAYLAVRCAERRSVLREAGCERELEFIGAYSLGRTAWDVRGTGSPVGSLAGLLVYVCAGTNDPQGDDLEYVVGRVRSGGCQVLTRHWDGGHKMPPWKHESYGELLDVLDPLLIVQGVQAVQRWFGFAPIQVHGPYRLCCKWKDTWGFCCVSTQAG